MPSKLSQFFRELKRRKVGRAVVGYAVVGVGVAEAADIFLPRLPVPAWTVDFVAFAILLGFPIVLVLAWVLEFTPEGIRRTPDLNPEEFGSHSASRSKLPGWALFGLGTLIVLMAGYLALSRTETEPSLPEDYAIVFPFENLTGNPELDHLGPLAAYWITDALGWIGEVREVSAAFVLQALSARGEGQTLMGFAADLGAGMAITGAFEDSGRGLEFRAELVRVETGELVHSEVSLVNTADPTVALDDLRQRVAAWFAAESILEDAGIDLFPSMPTLEAIQSWERGMMSFLENDYAAALPLLYEAYSADSTFLQALIWATAANLNLGRNAIADSLIGVLDRRGSTLNSSDRVWLDRYRADLRGDRVAELRAARAQAEKDPSGWGYSLANVALSQGRPQEALEALASIDKSGRIAREWSSYWGVLHRAHFDLENYEDALTAAREGRTRFPEYTYFLVLEIRALTAMGRIEEIEPLLGAITEIDPSGAETGYVLREAASVLYRFGHSESARILAEKAVAWYREQDSTACGEACARALLLAGRPGEAVNALRVILTEYPEELAVHGLLGIALAKAGDPEAAEAQSEWLGEVE